MDVQRQNGTQKLSRKARTDARLAWHDAALNVEQLAGLLQVSSAWVRRLTAEGVLRKVDGRYRLIDSVQAFLRYQKDEQRRTGKAAMQNRVIEARAREIELRTAVRERSLMETEQCIAVVDELCGLFLTGLSEMPAQCGGRDLKVRREIEVAVFELRRRIADKVKQKAQELSA